MTVKVLVVSVLFVMLTTFASSVMKRSNPDTNECISEVSVWTCDANGSYNQPYENKTITGTLTYPAGGPGTSASASFKVALDVRPEKHNRQSLTYTATFVLKDALGNVLSAWSGNPVESGAISSNTDPNDPNYPCAHYDYPGVFTINYSLAQNVSIFVAYLHVHVNCNISQLEPERCNFDPVFDVVFTPNNYRAISLTIVPNSITGDETTAMTITYDPSQWTNPCTAKYLHGASLPTGGASFIGLRGDPTQSPNTTVQRFISFVPEDDTNVYAVDFYGSLEDSHGSSMTPAVVLTIQR